MILLQVHLMFEAELVTKKYANFIEKNKNKCKDIQQSPTPHQTNCLRKLLKKQNKDHAVTNTLHNLLTENKEMKTTLAHKLQTIDVGASTVTQTVSLGQIFFQLKYPKSKTNTLQFKLKQYQLSELKYVSNIIKLDNFKFFLMKAVVDMIFSFKLVG